MAMLYRCVSGNVVNFAICDFYQDESFINLSMMVFKCIQNQNLKELRQYEKVHKELHQFVEFYLKKNLEIVFVKFDQQLIKYIIEQILIPGTEIDNQEIQTSSLNTIELINDFILSNRQSLGKKQKTLVAILNNFLE